MTRTNKRRTLAVCFVALVMIISVFTRGPIPQDPLYHDFADQRIFFGLPNAVNVLSNALFIMVGAWGLAFVSRIRGKDEKNILLTQYFLFFAGLFLSGIGSTFYHVAPSNASLVWDRLPMSIAFMALLSSVISEAMDRRIGGLLLMPLVLIGVFSVVYWALTESAGRGDLRLYALVQFLPVVMIPLILLLFKTQKSYAVSIWLLAGLYVVSKLFEVLDTELFVLTGIVSGHTVKHVVAALGAGFVLRMLYRRKQEFSPE